MTELRAFNNPEFGTIRTIVENGKTLFCGRDVASVLGYSDPKKAIARHCKGGTKRPLPTEQVELALYLFVQRGRYGEADGLAGLLDHHAHIERLIVLLAECT